MRPLLLAALTACTTTPTEPTDLPVDPRLEGSTYVLVTGGATIEGADQGLNDLAQLLLSRKILMHVDNVRADVFDVEVGIGTTADPPERDPCRDAVPFDDVELDGLAFSGGPRDLEIAAAGDPINIADMSVSGTWTEDGERINDFVISGTVDLRLADGTALGPAADLCHTFGGFGVPCQACPDSEPVCAALTAVGLAANRDHDVDFFDASPDPGECD